MNLEKKTKRTLFWSTIFQEPLATLYGFVAFILYKDLHASPFHIALLMTLKPLVGLLSFYWSSACRGRLRTNMMWAGILMRAPFLLIPWIDSLWFVIAACVNYMLFYRAGGPAWMEILKRNLPEASRGPAFSFSSAIGYGESVLLSLGLAAILDHNSGVWRMAFVVAAFLGLVGTFLQARIPVKEEALPQTSKTPLTGGIRISLWMASMFRPWQDALQLMRKRKDFALFQWGFMASGLAIMLIQPVLPLFVVDDLGISYVQIATAISVAKGLGWVVSSPWWGRRLENWSIHKLASLVFVVFAFFPLLVFFAKWQVFWLYVAYFWYGVGQGGSHLVWNWSGPYFAGNEESARYSGVNVAMVGLRGAFGPLIGGWLSMGCGVLPVFVIGTLLCAGSAALMSRISESLQSPSKI